MKTFLISAYHGWVFRNVLGSSAFSQLKERSDLRIVVCVPEDKAAFTQETYGGGNVIVHAFAADRIAASSYNRRWYRLGFLIQNTQYVRDQRLEQRERNRTVLGHLAYFWTNSLATVLSRIPAFIVLYRFLDWCCSPRNAVKEIFAQFHPDVVMAGDLFGEADVLFLRNAKAEGIRTIGMVRSWDNTTTKGILRLIPDTIIVNSVAIRDELAHFHHCPTTCVQVVGLPQFDSWLSGPTISREEFFRSIGADPRRRLILFAPAGSILSDTDWQLCDILKEAIARGALPSDIVILVRNHPQHPADLSQFTPDEHFVIETPGTRTTAKEIGRAHV